MPPDLARHQTPGGDWPDIGVFDRSRRTSAALQEIVPERYNWGVNEAHFLRDTMSEDFLSKRRTALEDSFFRRRDAELLEEMKKGMTDDSRRDALAESSGITDEAMLNRFMELKLSADTVAALSLVPLVQVAWADNKLESQERDAILTAASESGVAKDKPAYKLLLSWLESAPEPDMLEAWQDYVKSLGEVMSAEDRASFRDGLLSRVTTIAESTGGILGLGNKVSDSEQAVIDGLMKAFDA